MPPKKPTAARLRDLPKEKNELMLKETSSDVLATKCRVQDVRFNRADGVEQHVETFVRIKTQRPNMETPHFIMRKAVDDYVSATSMFRAVFYLADTAQERLEMTKVAKDLGGRSDSFASGTWVSSKDALTLADLYGIRPWIEALLAAPAAKSAGGASPPTTADNPSLVQSPPVSAGTGAPANVPQPAIAPAPAIEPSAATPADKPKAAPATAPKRGRSPTRKVSTVSPAKAASSKAQPKSAGAGSSIPAAAGTNLTTSAGSLASQSNAPTSSSSAQESSASDMMAKARADVAAAQKKEAENLLANGFAQSPVSSSGSTGATEKPTAVAKTPRRKRARPADDDDVNGAVAATSAAGAPSSALSPGQPPAKRTRVAELEVQVARERRKVRALFGLVLGLSATAVLPYVL
ncbi:hypothetical protein PYCC9005_005961 [Savitreella phatthalungensis]